MRQLGGLLLRGGPAPWLGAGFALTLATALPSRRLGHGANDDPPATSAAGSLSSSWSPWPGQNNTPFGIA